MDYIRSPYSMPLVVKNLLIINGVCFLATILLKSSFDINLYKIFGLHYFGSELFKPWQIFTYLFMHGDFTHLFFNMFALWIFGSTIENIWGSKRFMNYYLICGLGAGLVQMIVLVVQIFMITKTLSPELVEYVYSNGLEVWNQDKNFIIENMGELNKAINKTTVGASGSVFGLLLAFGMMFPDSKIYVYFLVPIKAKWFVIIYGAIELMYGISGAQTGIAHFAHLGGMLFGFFLIRYWKKRSG